MTHRGAESSLERLDGIKSLLVVSLILFPSSPHPLPNRLPVLFSSSSHPLPGLIPSPILLKHHRLSPSASPRPPNPFLPRDFSLDLQLSLAH
jgi:hypothetical protein